MNTWKLLALLALAALWCGTDVPTAVGQDADNAAAAVESIPPVSKSDATGKVKLSLRGGLELEGTPVEIETLKVNSLFGEAAIPLNTIAGVRFAQAAGEQTTIVLQNGDVLTGEVGLTDLKFVADWGEATVNVSHLASLVFRDDLTWTGVSTPSGQRWRLTRIQPASTPSQPTNNSNVRVYRQN